MNIKRRRFSLAESNLAEGRFDEFRPALNEKWMIMPTVREIYDRGVTGERRTGIGDVLFGNAPSLPRFGAKKE